MFFQSYPSVTRQKAIWSNKQLALMVDHSLGTRDLI